jgi:hypothetical protein
MPAGKSNFAQQDFNAHHKDTVSVTLALLQQIICRAIIVHAAGG